MAPAPMPARTSGKKGPESPKGLSRELGKRKNSRGQNTGGDGGGAAGELRRGSRPGEAAGAEVWQQEEQRG